METSDRFRPDNTAGYTLVQLEELNRRYLAASDGAVPLECGADVAEWLLDHIAEGVQRDYDTELSAPA